MTFLLKISFIALLLKKIACLKMNIGCHKNFFIKILSKVL